MAWARWLYGYRTRSGPRTAGIKDLSPVEGPSFWRAGKIFAPARSQSRNRHPSASMAISGTPCSRFTNTLWPVPENHSAHTVPSAVAGLGSDGLSAAEGQDLLADTAVPAAAAAATQERRRDRPGVRVPCRCANSRVLDTERCAHDRAQMLRAHRMHDAQGRTAAVNAGHCCGTGRLGQEISAEDRSGLPGKIVSDGRDQPVLQRRLAAAPRPRLPSHAPPAGPAAHRAAGAQPR